MCAGAEKRPAALPVLATRRWDAVRHTTRLLPSAAIAARGAGSRKRARPASKARVGLQPVAWVGGAARRARAMGRSTSFMGVTLKSPRGSAAHQGCGHAHTPGRFAAVDLLDLRTPWCLHV